ncbi:MAG: UvrD-helicase domain-containing protein [Chitinispirillaceae bacterium]|nr:UvrD-helicase domain-containing protein [Chitinispirillaceae bacterium]
MEKMPEVLIDSSEIIDDFDKHFKVSAGPGAGKTFWLANHVINVVRKSNRLHSCAKILCISYTNIAC